jgi:large subunit ribosomal protein L14e
MTLDMQRGARTGTVKKVIAKENLADKWAKSAVAQKLAKQNTRKNLSDLERFSAMINRKRRSYGARKVAAKALGKAKGKK